MIEALPRDLSSFLAGFSLSKQRGLFEKCDGSQTLIQEEDLGGHRIRRYVNEFWTSRQRQACALHEVSYRACFKPQLPRFFIELLTEPGDRVYDPFSGRGTTAIEAGLMRRQALANDVNPLSEILASPRLSVPNLGDLEERLSAITFRPGARPEIDLSMFYHPDTEAEIVSLRDYLREKRAAGSEDSLDLWIRMVATNRLTGHSKGFFSVYTLPPNQAVAPRKQVEINARLKQTPEYRDTRRIILDKTRSLLRGLSVRQMANLREAGVTARFLTRDARETPEIASDSVQLTVTSPPFLDVVQYASDNWLRCWFNDIDVEAVSRRITAARSVEAWAGVMGAVFAELYRVTRPEGWVAFEVGEVRKGSVRLDEHVVPLGIAAGFSCKGIVINAQSFTKTANIWGVRNNERGTNTNRIVLFQKAGPQP